MNRVRNARVSFALLALAVPAAAQGSLRTQVQPVTAPVKYAGVYHLGTGTWTRPVAGSLSAPGAGSGAAILYDNTCIASYFAALDLGARIVDEGRLPSPSSPVLANAWGLGNDSERGTQARYTIDGFQIGYCSSSATPVDFTMNFYQAYQACSASPAASTATFALTGLPGAQFVGSQSCWTLDIDLCAASQSFTMLADADQVYNGTAGGLDDTFGWSFQLTSSSTPTLDGCLLAGGAIAASSFVSCSGSDGTLFDTGTTSPIYPLNSDAIALGCGTLAAGAAPEAGSGMGTQDLFRVENSGMLQDGCYFFGGNPLGSFYLQLYSVDVALQDPSAAVSFCSPALGGTPACPCQNIPDQAGRGCDNSAITGGASLVGSGAPTLAADTLSFHVTGAVSRTVSALLQGSSATPGAVYGQGIRCVGGVTKLLYLHTTLTGGSTFPASGEASLSARSATLGDPIAPGQPRYYYAVYRDPVVPSGCPAAATINASDANAVLWN
ncbi:MAG: hypothetical protein IPJ19_12230 [Planctomycetes bacterium]|nr:hypothetical protein [Planctomycetota bacterium]